MIQNAICYAEQTRQFDSLLKIVCTMVKDPANFFIKEFVTEREV